MEIEVTILAATLAAMAQAASPAESATGIEQIATPNPATPERAVRTQQLSHREASVPASSATSRRTYVAPVKGQDRCSTANGPKPVVCHDPIEARADEFTPTDPTPLSPEQRAAVGERLLQARPVAEADRAKRLGEVDDDTIAGQSIISGTGWPGATSQPDPAPTATSDLERAIASGVILPSDTALPGTGGR